MATNGLLSAGLAIGLGLISFKPKRGFYPTDTASIIAQATLEEVHHDELEITDHPVERQANISDHAFKRPEEVIIRCAWSNSPSLSASQIISNPVATAASVFDSIQSAAQSVLSGAGPGQIVSVYDQLIALQKSRVPFDVFTGKRAYQNMLFKSLTVTTDNKSENALYVTAVCRQVILASTSVITVPINVNAQAKPQETTLVQNIGSQSLRVTQGVAPADLLE